MLRRQSHVGYPTSREGFLHRCDVRLMAAEDWPVALANGVASGAEIPNVITRSRDGRSWAVLAGAAFFLVAFFVDFRGILGLLSPGTSRQPGHSLLGCRPEVQANLRSRLVV